MNPAFTSECSARGHGSLAGVWSNLSQDVVRYLNKSPANIAQGDTFKSRLSAFLTPDLLSLLFYRISHYLYVKKMVRLARGFGYLNSFLHRVTITPQSC